MSSLIHKMNVIIFLAIGLLIFAKYIPKFFYNPETAKSVDDYCKMSRSMGMPIKATNFYVSDGKSRLLQKGEIIGSIIPPSKDYSIVTDKTYSEIKLYIWDYADEDGDYIQLFQNGCPISEPFMITNAVKEISIPNTGAIQVKGIKDGRGGISYAVKFETGVAYLNVLSPGCINTYTIN